MTDKPRETDPLEAFFKAGRSNPTEPDGALMARILADAEAQQSMTRAMAHPVRHRRSGWLVALAGAIGGWPGMAGLATATVAGVWIGASAPPGLSGVAQTVLADPSGGYVVDYDVSDTFQILEGGL